MSGCGVDLDVNDSYFLSMCPARERSSCSDLIYCTMYHVTGPRPVPKCKWYSHCSFTFQGCSLSPDDFVVCHGMQKSYFLNALTHTKRLLNPSSLSLFLHPFYIDSRPSLEIWSKCPIYKFMQNPVVEFSSHSKSLC
jgi:hypothetical protein